MRCVPQLLKCGNPEIIVVDDGSKDWMLAIGRRASVNLQRPVALRRCA